METSTEFPIKLVKIENCPVAVVDIDHTLVYSAKGGKLKLNEKLLQALKARGIRDLYLFTDMIISAASIEDRLKLISKLKKRGFVVQGVITPLDYFWEFDQEKLKQLDEALCQSRVIMREEAPRNLEKIEMIVAQFPSVFERVKSSDYPKFGQAFAEAEQAYLLQSGAQNKDSMAKLAERSMWCKMAIDVISYLRKLPSSKAIMMLQFLHHLPTWVLSIKVFDDKKENIEAVKIVKDLFQTHIPIETYHGEFDERGDTFAIQLAPELFLVPMPVEVVAPKDNGGEVVLRIIDIAAKLQKDIKELQATELFGGFRFKKEFTQAEKFFSKVVASAANFETIWECVLAELRPIPKNRAGVYLLSGFDQKLVEALCSDPVICDKICSMDHGPKKHDLTKAITNAEYPLFIQIVLGEKVPKKEGILSLSMGSVRPLMIKRNSSAATSMKNKPISEEPSSQAELLGLVRKRSLTADSSPNLDYLKPSSSLPRVPHSSANESPDSSQELGEKGNEVSGRSHSNIKN